MKSDSFYFYTRYYYRIGNLCNTQTHKETAVWNWNHNNYLGCRTSRSRKRFLLGKIRGSFVDFSFCRRAGLITFRPLQILFFSFLLFRTRRFIFLGNWRKLFKKVLLLLIRQGLQYWQKKKFCMPRQHKNPYDFLIIVFDLATRIIVN